MKHLLYLLFCLCLFIKVQSQEKVFNQLLNEDFLNSIIRYDSSTFISKCELTNIEYLEYLYYCSKDSTEEFYNSQCIPEDVSEYFSTCHNTLLIEDPISYDINQPGLRDFPVVGVSYEQIINYCTWKQNKFYNEIQSSKKRKIKRINSNYDIKFKVRPFKMTEWPFISESAIIDSAFIEKLDHKDFTFFKDILPYNYRTKELFKRYKLDSNHYYLIVNLGVNDQVIMFDKKHQLHLIEYKKHRCYLLPNHNFDGIPTKNGFYGVTGNVSELSQEKGIAFGANFNNSLEEANSSRSPTIPYQTYQPWLGARITFEIEIIKKQ